MSDNELPNSLKIKNYFISNFNSFKYLIFEPMMLIFYRFKDKDKYSKSNTEPLVSVCIPTYNRDSILINRSIKSALSQTYKNLEVIIVGDNCTDKTEEFVLKINDPRIRFYNLPERKRDYYQIVENHWFVGGAIPANKAMRLARGEWIARIDDDDVWANDHIEKLLSFAIKNNFEFVSSMYEEVRFGNKKIVDGNQAISEYFVKDYKKSPKGPKIGGVQTWVFRSYLGRLQYNVDCWRKSWNKVWDVDLAVRIFKAGARIGFLDNVSAYIYPRPGEETVGLDAYKMHEKEKLDHYKF